VCACIAALSARQHESPDLDRLLVKLRNMGSQLEMDVRGLYKQELEAIKVKLEQLEDPSPLPQPTDAELTGVLRAHFPELRDIGTSNVRRIAGVTAKETFFFDLRNCPGWPVGMVLRRESKFNATRTFVADELPLLNRLHDEGIPVPRALIADAEGRGLRAGFIMVERLSGAPRTAEQWGPSGPQIALEMAAILARIHRIDPRTLDAPYQAAGSSSQAEVLRRLEDFYKRWVESRTETTVSLEAAYSWMREHVGCVGPELSLVHGDCNFRNILLDGDRISALLDWELAHPGHAAEDLAYIKGDVEKIMPWSGFLEVYRQHGGVPVTDDAIRYFEIWANVWRTTLAQNCHAAYVKGDHDSYLYGSVGHNEYYASLDPLGAAMISL
jgi:aminoglycoside phosphotransferase (APT) family kinase protein